MYCVLCIIENNENKINNKKNILSIEEAYTKQINIYKEKLNILEIQEKIFKKDSDTLEDYFMKIKKDADENLSLSEEFFNEILNYLINKKENIKKKIQEKLEKENEKIFEIKNLYDKNSILIKDYIRESEERQNDSKIEFLINSRYSNIENICGILSPTDFNQKIQDDLVEIKKNSKIFF